ncbi:DNA recombination protein RmuC [Thauera humireducens]|uniref:DNA recombination protein RmuC n=1 Tax=Thauera humireducens TaxID=1134435 RepID=UPI0024679FEE|nr:DNA recombination protein RmuC [Thauera humireducens]CAH1749143.1 DNA recombination protein RmuC [Thauera humireducens]
MLSMTPSELLLAGLLAAVLVLLAWLLVRSYTRERAVRDQLVDALADQMEQQLGAQHREILRDLHEGLARQTDRIGEHARADRDLLQRGLTAASMQLSRGMQALTQSVDGRLDTLSGQVNQRLDEGFRKTNETFASVMARLATIDEAQKKIDGLTTNVVSLQELLGDKRARGAFGEVQLEALVQNMLPPDAFAFQHVLPNGTRVDCLLTLPAPTGLVAVDAKFPLENYHRMFDAASGELERRAAQQAFRADVKRHVDAIAGKYILPGTTSDGAVMFLPAEAVFAEVHAYHPEIVAYAQQKRVWIVSPTTLMAVLNTARAVLKDVETRKQVHVIQDALGKLAKDFQRFDERMAALARHIEQASRDVQEVQTSSRKISAHFHKIEAARFDELEPDADAVPLPRT